MSACCDTPNAVRVDTMRDTMRDTSRGPAIGATPRAIRVALAGNPNSGKTSLFNALAGTHHKVGNYPGVTVEKREGRLAHRGVDLVITDLPGIYSLTAYALDEVVTRDFMLQERPDIVIDVLDSTNLERNLFLGLQLMELGLPVVGALNMTDEAEAKGITIDRVALADALGIPMVRTVARTGQGTEALLDAVLDAVGARAGAAPRGQRYGEEIESRIATLVAALEKDNAFSAAYPARWFAVKLLERDPDAAARLAAEHRDGASVARIAEEARRWIGGHFGKDSEIVISEQRYGYIRGALAESVRIARARRRRYAGELIDAALMHPIAGIPIFLGIMWGVFTLTFALGDLPARWLESLFTALSGAVSAAMPDGLLKSLIVDGVIGGVGGVFSFVPLVVILFLCLAILEDVGYMSRAAFLTDRFLHAIGLHGQSFLPMVLGFGCSVPAIMATRTLKSPRDRIATILAIPFMSCGAKMPVHVLLAGAFFPRRSGAVVMLVYLAGIVLALLSTLILRRTVLKGPTTSFVMELPPYRVPTAKGILWHVWSRTWQYVKKAGTVILISSIIIWAITTFPAPDSAALASHPDPDAFRLSYSAAGRIGAFVVPVLAPLGFDWKIAVASITGFAAKETVVSTLGILYGQGGESGESGLRAALAAAPGMDASVAIALMLFILVMPPCLAALAAIRSEAGGKWLAFQVAWSLALAWIAAFAARHAALLFMA